MEVICHFRHHLTNKRLSGIFSVLAVWTLSFIFPQEPPFVFASKELPEVEGVTFKHYYNSVNQTYYYGYCIDLLYALNDTMSFEFTLMEPVDGAYGTMQPDGSWNGMIRELIDDVWNSFSLSSNGIIYFLYIFSWIEHTCHGQNL